MAAGFKTATVASGDVPATQTNFPAYVDLSRLGITTQAEADSVRVYADSSKTTEWAREIVSATEMHVKVPSLTSTTSIYVDWDGSSADYAVTDTYGRNAVWTGYKAVYHGNGTTDSTGNGYTLTNTGSTPYNDGKIGKCFDGGTSNTSKRMYVNTTFGMLGSTARTFTCWTKQNTTLGSGAGDVYFRHLFGGSAAGNYANVAYVNTGGTTYITMPTSPSGMSVAYTLTVGTWYHQRVTVPASNTGNIALYTNATSVGTTANWAQNYGLTTRLGILTDHDTDYSDVSVDEFRLQSGNQADNWTTTEYNNQNDEAGFWGTWSDVGGGGSPDTTKFFALMH